MRFQTIAELREKQHGSVFHAPTGAWAGSPTNSRSFLGGTVWIWVDDEGREIGKSNAVPPNIYGETTRPGVLAGTPPAGYYAWGDRSESVRSAPPAHCSRPSG